MKKFLIIFIIMFSFSILIIPMFVLNLSPKRVGDNKLFHIEKGDNLTIIAEKLKNENYIKNKEYFKLLATLLNKSKKMQTGLYNIPKNADNITILDIFSKGKQHFIKIVIPEGATLKSIAKKLDENQIIEYDKFINAVNSFDLKNFNINKIGADGFLYPDTYFFTYESDEAVIVKAMVENFFIKICDLKIDIEKDFYKKIILASIVEKEYKLDEEAPIIASVFKNRLKIDMPLQSCATVVYIITEIMGKKHPTRLFYSDLEIDNRYNTYKYYGLPPSPICNPGFVAIKSVFTNYESDYLYFALIDAEAGKHSFSKNFSSHNKNYLDYIKRD